MRPAPTDHATVDAREYGFASGGANRSSPPALRCTAMLLLCAASAAACGSWTELRPSELPRLIAARTEEIEVTATDGSTVTVSRSGVQAVELQTDEGFELMTRPGSGSIARVPEGHVGEAEQGGWESLPTFEKPIAMQLRGEDLTVRGGESEATVRVRDVERVRVKQFSSGKTAAVILGPILGGALAVALLASCWPCVYTGGPR